MLTRRQEFALCPPTAADCVSARQGNAAATIRIIINRTSAPAAVHQLSGSQLPGCGGAFAPLKLR